jgi:hypothetical protein
MPTIDILHLWDAGTQWDAIFKLFLKTLSVGHFGKLRPIASQRPISVRFIFKELFYIVNIMDSHSINQLAKFKKLMMLYGHYERVGNLCIFRSKGKAKCVNIDSKYLIFD